MRKRIYAHIIVLLVTLIASFDANQWLYAKEETIVPSVIRYSVNNKEAEILFNVEGVNEEAYELETIISDNDGTVVYDGTQDISEDIAYTVRENGEYSFTITYIENQGEETEEKSTVLTASVTELIATEETKTNEVDNTEESYEVIDINESEEEAETIKESNKEETYEVIELNDSGEDIEANESDEESAIDTLDSSTVVLNNTNFPDDALRTYLKSTYGFLEDQDLTAEEIAQVKIINISGTSSSPISLDYNLKGIEHFTSLTTLTVTNTTISSIDVSKLSKLQGLYVYQNYNLSEIKLPNEKNNLTVYSAYNTNISGTIDVSEYINLDRLVIGNNSGIEKIDISGCIKITALDAGNCSSLGSIEGLESCISLESLKLSKTKIVSLNLSCLTALETLETYSNTSLTDLNISNTSLTDITLSGCSALTTLSASNTQLTSLNLTSLPVKTLDVSGSALTDITLYNCTALTTLNASDTQLTSLNITGLPVITVDVSDSAKLESLNATRCRSLTDLNVSNSALAQITLASCTALTTVTAKNTQLESLTLTGLEKVETVDVSDSIELASISFVRCYALKTVNASNTALSSLYIGNHTNLEKLDVSGCTKLSELRLVGDTALEELNVSNTILETLQVTDNKALKTIDINDCSELTSLDLSSCVVLETLNVSRNADLTDLNLSGCTVLVTLNVASNISLVSLDLGNCSGLSELNVTNNTALVSLDVSNTLISSLDVKNCGALETLIVSGSKITGKLFLENSTSLKTIDASNTDITEIYLTCEAALTNLDVSSTKIETLNLEGYVKLKTVNASDNAQLTTIYLTNDVLLENLDISNTSICSVTLTNFTVLTTLDVSNTDLTSLDVSDCTNLTTLYANNANITMLDLSNNSSLNELTVQNNPLAYVNLTDSIGSFTTFERDPLTEIQISEVYQDKDKGYWISLENFFSGINIRKISNVAITGSGTYDARTGTITGLTVDSTISYTYDTDGTGTYTIQPTILIVGTTVLSTPPAIESVDTELTVGTTLTEFDLQTKYAFARISTDTTFHSLSESQRYSLSIEEVKYYFFNYTDGKFEEIADVNNFLNFEKGSGIYAYVFTVKDTTNNLTATGVSRFFVKDSNSEIKMNKDSSTYYILFNDIASKSTVTLSETQIAASYYDEDKFHNFIESYYSYQGYIDYGGLDIEVAAVNIDYSGFSGKDSEPTSIVPGSYNCNIQLLDSDGTLKIKSDSFSVTVTQNASSYEEDNVSTDNGASGYLIIPKYIELKNDVNNTMTADVEVKFANYENATGVKYGLKVDKTFDIVNTSDKNDTITVTTSSSEANVIESSSENKLCIGGFTIDNINSGKMLTFTASRIGVAYGARWVGSVTFTFYRE